jgi:RsiW-degrading membrane proteinase PrsW (M82 family)
VRLGLAAVPAVLVGRAVAWAGHSWWGTTKAAAALELVVGGVLVLAVYVLACRLLRVSELAELAEQSTDLELFRASVVRWHDWMQARPDLRL